MFKNILQKLKLRERERVKRNFGFTPTPNFCWWGYGRKLADEWSISAKQIDKSYSCKLMTRGFTLIELLIVIAIIGLLSSVVLASLNSARKKARDARRVSDIKQISLALEMFYDTNGYYPKTGGAWRSECAIWGSYAANDVIPGLVSGFMPVFPSDPSMDKAASRSCYLYSSGLGGTVDGAEYAFLDHDVSDINYASRPELLDPVRDGGSNSCILDGASYWSWKVSSPGARCW